jgi:hypothetical protein
MSETSDAVLLAEIDSAINEIISTGSAKCPAHEPMARGVVVLLRVARVQMQANARTVLVAGTTSSIVAGIILGLVAAAKQLGLV